MGCRKVQLLASDITYKLERPIRIGCLGLAFKPDVDDLRESPALQIVSELLVAGFDVLACEPNLSSHPTINLYSLEHVLSESDLLVCLVAHRTFKGLDLSGRYVLDLVVSLLIPDFLILIVSSTLCFDCLLHLQILVL